MTFPTGVPVPNSDALCAAGDSAFGFVAAEGYAVPAATVAKLAIPAHSPQAQAVAAPSSRYMMLDVAGASQQNGAPVIQ
jgi:hypothetical protein